jgi:type VI secretion system protein ImpF
MNEPARSERITPSLLDRLTDEEPGVSEEGRDQRVLNSTQYLETVLRDLRWLLGTRTHLPDMVIKGARPNSARRTKPDTDDVAEKVLADFPEVARSVIAYGLPDVTGVATASLNLPEYLKLVRQTILAFEPRIDSRTLQVDQLNDKEKEGEQKEDPSHFWLSRFWIQADVLMQPKPDRLDIKTTLDLGSGEMALERARRADA